MAASVTTFSEFSLQPVLQAAVDALGVSTPTPIQAQAIPTLLSGRDLIGQARTGSGKTLAFAIPAVARANPSSPDMQVLILVPTRELAVQVGEVFRSLTDARRLRLALLYGGHSMLPERRALYNGAQLVVGTPGRTLDHIRQGNLSLRRVRYVVLDEADEMLDKGFGPDVERILSVCSPNRQTALFSATMPEWAKKTAARYLKDPAVVQIDSEAPSPDSIDHIIYEMHPDVRLAALRHLLDQRGTGPVIIFGRTKHGVTRLATKLNSLGYPADALQGNLSQNARERVMAAFRSGELPILLATNVAARGIDVDGIEQVINYELPDSPELFSHRAGRTGRMGKSGEVITFLTPEDAPKWRQIERALGRRLPRKAWAHVHPTVVAADGEKVNPLAAAVTPRTAPTPVTPARLHSVQQDVRAPQRERRQPRFRTQRSAPPASRGRSSRSYEGSDE